MNAEPNPTRPDTPVDAGSQALSEALRASFTIVRIVMAVLVVVFLASGFFTVGPQEKAIILRFGKPLGEGEKALLGAGLHWSLPYPIDEYVKVPITEIQEVRSRVGWYAVTDVQEATGQEPFFGPSLNPIIDGYLLTADGNIVHSRAALSYRISDPKQYIFGFVNASNAAQNALDNALVATAAQFGVDDILTRDVTGFKEAVRKRVTDLLDRYQLGVSVEQCIVESRPPRQLKDKFAEVLKAEVTRNQKLDEARSYENQVLSKASAEAAGRINVAESERNRLVQSLAAEVERFKGLLPNYQSNPQLFVQQNLVQTMASVLTNVTDKIYLPTTTDGKPIELRLLLNREPPKPKTEAPAQ